MQHASSYEGAHEASVGVGWLTIILKVVSLVVSMFHQGTYQGNMFVTATNHVRGSGADVTCSRSDGITVKDHRFPFFFIWRRKVREDQ